MNKDELRVKVAEALGWTLKPEKFAIDNTPVWHCPNGWAHPPKSDPMTGYWYEAETILPDYPNDLNACAEMEKQAPMGYADAVRYEVAKSRGVQAAHLSDQYLISANAEQRCRAFLKIMEKSK